MNEYKVVISLFANIFIIGCGKQEQPKEPIRMNKTLYSDANINHHIIKIKTHLNKFGLNKSMLERINDTIYYFSDFEEDFKKKGENTSAFCRLNTNEVFINKFRWNIMPEHTRTAVIAHEIGHCTYKLEHNITPYEIMYKEIIRGMVFKDNHWNVFTDEICKKENLNCS